MRYITKEDAERHGINLEVANISTSGSIRGMRQKYGWAKDAQVRVGSYIYNIGREEMERALKLGIVRGI